MTKSTSVATPATPVITRDKKVIDLIGSAVRIESTLVDACKAIGKAIAEQLNPMGLPVKSAVAAGMAVYGDDMSANIKAMVSNAITLALSAPDTPITYTIKGEEKHTTAGEALTLPKHDFNAATSALRADIGTGRASGAGRPPKTPVLAKHGLVSTTDNDIELAFAAWLHNLPVYFNDPEKALKITSALKDMGLKLQVIKTGK
jgi:hypothetical protein